MLLLLTIIAAHPPDPAAAQTSPRIREYLREELTLEIDPPRPPLCIAEPDYIDVKIGKVGVYQDVENRWYVPRPRPYRIVDNNWGPTLPGLIWGLSNPRVLHLDRDRAWASVPSYVYHHWPLVASGVGSTTIDFRATLPGAEDARANVTVEVKECDFEVHTFSIWHVSGTGWNTVFGSSIDTVVTQQPIDPSASSIKVENPNATSSNLAVSFPGFGCAASYTISTMRSPIDGHLAFVPYGLHLTIEYPDRVASGKLATCIVVQASNQGTATLDPVSFTLAPDFLPTAQAPHVIHVEGLGDYTGTTFIQVDQIPR